MLLLDEFDGVRYVLLEHVDVAEMARVIGHVFSRSDPLGVAIGMAAEDIEAFVLVFGTKAVAEGLTVIARGRTGALVGAMFSDDFGTPPPDLDNVPVSFAPVGALLERLDEDYRRTRSIVEGSHAHFNMLATFFDQVKPVGQISLAENQLSLRKLRPHRTFTQHLRVRRLHPRQKRMLRNRAAQRVHVLQPLAGHPATMHGPACRSFLGCTGSHVPAPPELPRVGLFLQCSKLKKCDHRMDGSS